MSKQPDLHGKNMLKQRLKQIYNPYLPLYEYIPDGEPRVFDDRIYIYGSHDSASGKRYCENDYLIWSAPVDDLASWRNEGISYRKMQDPSNQDNQYDLWAPDVVKGPDGRYYLYYCLSFYPEFGIAVSNSPAGPFEYYGCVKYPPNIMNGKKLQEPLPFDPAVLVDQDNRIFLYYGFSPAQKIELPSHEKLLQMGLSEEEISRLENMSRFEKSQGCMVVELEQDMLTIKESPRLCVPGGQIAEGTDFEGHAFYEASSIRRIDDRYYFIYSSQLSHELCYAISQKPNEGFIYGGTIVSNGDIGYQGNIQPVAMMGNNHGSITQIGDEWYVFYHRQTHGTEASRQGCAEKIKIMSDGSIPQVEITSCGLNAGPLIGEGIYPAAIACHLTRFSDMKKITYGDVKQINQPYIFEDLNGNEQGHIQYIANISDGVDIGFKYFEFRDTVESMNLTLRGEVNGSIQVRIDAPDGLLAGSIKLDLHQKYWSAVKVSIKINAGVHAIYLTYRGAGTCDLKEIEFVQMG